MQMQMDAGEYVDPGEKKVTLCPLNINFNENVILNSEYSGLMFS